MAAELVETSRLWARTVARIEPEWVEPLAAAPGPAQLQRAALGEETRRGGRLEKVTLYGVPLVVDRKVPTGGSTRRRPRAVHQARAGGGGLADQPPVLRREPEAAGRGRGGGAPGPPPRPGRERRRAVRVLRRADPGGCGLGPHFDTWWKQARRADPDLLTFKASDLLSDDAAGVSADAYPDVWTSESAGLPPAPLSYAFEPGSETDGVTVDIPLSGSTR